MKKFLMYVIIVVTCLFLGFTIYYLAQNNEKITMTISNDESIYINKGDSFALPIIWTKPYKDTTMTVSVDETLLSYDEETKMVTGVKGGFSSITITTTNKNFGPFIFEVYVGDGTSQNPYAISGKKENLYDITLDQIGQGDYTLDKHYMLIEDVEMSALSNGTWTPLGELSGSFNGNGHTIFNMEITSGTNVGLFSSIAYNGMVENVKFAKAVIDGSFETAGLVTGVNNGTVGKVEVISANITNSNASGFTGAIVGVNKYSTKPAVVNMCSVDSATISGNGTIGGLVGENTASIILNSRAIVNEFKATENTACIGGIVGEINTLYYGETDLFYYSHISKVYSIIEKITGETAVRGAVVGNNNSDYNSNPTFVNKFDNILYTNHADSTLKGIGSSVYSLTDAMASEFTLTDKEQLLNKSTYTNYDMANVWAIEDGTNYADINYSGNYESLRIVAVSKYINNEQLFTDFLDAIKANHSLQEEYRITEDITIDIGEIYGTTEWTTIAPLSTDPLLTSIIVEEGVTCVIKNFKLSNDNTSFFGYIGSGVTIRGITFGENIIIENTSENSAVVATGVLPGGTLENITVTTVDVQATTIKTNAKNVGVISATNEGTIKNCKVSPINLLTVTVVASGVQGNVGGIVGYNKGLINNCNVDMLKLVVDTSNNDTSSFNVGGICGMTESNITECGVDGFTFDSSNNGVMYAGGVVGYTTANTIKIYKNYSNATIKLNVNNSNAYVAGIVAYVSTNVTVQGCAYDNQSTLRGYNVAGIAGINYGTVTTSYSNSYLEGNKVAGLVTLNYATLGNCYTLSALAGVSDDSSVNGITALVGQDCTIDKCFSSSTFVGSGKKYAESESSFRMYELFQNVAGIFNSKYKFGDVSNLIIVNYGDAKVQTVIFGLKNAWWNNTWIEATEDECKGSDGYSIFTDAGYDTSIWNFTNVGSYPTLIDCATPPVVDVVE